MKYCKNTTTPGDFRLIRAFTVAHNIDRLRKHLKRLERDTEQQRWLRRFRVKQRFSTRMQRRQAA